MEFLKGHPGTFDITVFLDGLFQLTQAFNIVVVHPVDYPLDSVQALRFSCVVHHAGQALDGPGEPLRYSSRTISLSATRHSCLLRFVDDTHGAVDALLKLGAHLQLSLA